MRKAKVAAAMVLTAPFIPMLFQGEEFGASSPFLYFAQHDDPVIARSVSEGRRLEHAHEGDANSIPDPEAQATYESSKLHWEEREQGEHGEMLTWHRSLIQLRRNTPALRDGNPDHVQVHFDEEHQWLVMERGPIHLCFNFGDDPLRLAVPDGSSIQLATDAGLDVVSGQITLPGASFAAVAI
jgi:maltooligosyltrehalose trehalohydrolase